MDKAAKIAASPSTYVKGPAGNTVRTDSEGWHFIRVCDDARHLTQAFCHPQSPRNGDPTLVAPILRRFAHQYEYLTPGASNLADFGISPTLSEMYLLLRTAYPDLILPTYKQRWEKAIEVNADAILQKYGQVFRDGVPGTGYPNAHTHYIVALLFASQILNRKDYADTAAAGVKLMTTCLYPDGGTCYINWQNECYNYHEIAVRDMARYWQVTGNESAKQLSAGTRWYYPLSVEPSGVAEYSTSPSWKPYWNMSTGAEGAAVVASLTNCPHNQRVAKTSKIDGNFWIAALYRDDIAPAPAPDYYLTHDRNIEGPRGRFGLFSFWGTARDYKDDARGKQTYVGCMAMYPKNTPLPKGAVKEWPLSAALHSVGAEVRFANGAPDVNRWKTHLCLARQERNTFTTTKRFAALTTEHRLSIYGGPATDWFVTQQWLFTEDRLAGVLTMEALSDQKALGIGGSLLFVSGRGGWGVRKTFQQIAPDTWQYGALIARIHQQTPGHILTDYTDVMSGDSKKSGLLQLSDTTTPREKLYPKGTRVQFAVEIYPEWSKPAQFVKGYTTNGLHGIELQEAGQHLHLLHNPSNEPVQQVTERAYVLPGAQYRAPWLGDASTSESHPPGAATIAPHSHLLIVG